MQGPSSTLSYFSDLNGPLPREAAEHLLKATWELHDKPEVGAVVFIVRQPGRSPIKVIVQRDEDS